MVLDCFDHHLMLQGRCGNLHPARPPDCRVGNIPITADLVRGVHDHHPLGFCQDPGSLTQHGGFANPRATEDQQALALIDQVLEDIDRAIHGTPNAAGQSDNVSAAVADGRNPVQGAF